jgi:four helix bundle protein
MATLKSFEDIDVWQLARQLALDICAQTQSGSFSKDFSLRDQINKSAGAIMDNIAEGFERGGNKEFIQFPGIAKESAGEVRSQLYRASDRKHLTSEQFNDLKEKSIIISKKINDFLTYLPDCDIRGMKFHEPQESYLPNI